jgi:Glutamate dehydrogenase/leucine dehydrogenase
MSTPIATTPTAPAVSVLAEHVSEHLSVFVVAEDTTTGRPANGGLRLLNYPTDAACIADGERLAGLMTHKHDLYGTGFAGGKIVARAAEPAAVKEELISVTATLLEALDGSMITGCDLNTSLKT